MAEEAVETVKPAPGKRLALPVDMPLRRGLRIAWADMLDYAQSQEERVAHDHVTAVHEFRKSIRRCRSMLRLLRKSLPPETYQRLRDELRAIHRSTSRLRDRDVVLQTLDGLGDVPDSSRLDADIVEPARATIVTAEPVNPETARQTLEQARPKIRAAKKRLGKALAKKVRWKVVAADLERTYRRARDDMRATERGMGDEVIHDWRKRTKELMYQIELLLHGAERGKGRKLRRRISRLSERLGQVIDLLVLEEYVREHVAEDRQEPLINAIHIARAHHQAAALAAGQKLFKRKPKDFTRRLIDSSKRARSKPGPSESPA